jgi:tetratricopeptide (TPR) repeat protein
MNNSFITKLLTVVLSLFFTNNMSAQKKDLAYYQCTFFESYKAGSMTSWPSLIGEMEKAKSTDIAWQTEMVKAMYGLVGYHLGKKNKDLARMYIEKADIYLNKYLKLHPKNAQLHALFGAFYGYKIGLAMYKAPFLGPKSLSHIDQAIQLDPSEPMGYIEKGNSLMYRPAVFGGNKNEALALYRKALKLTEEKNQSKCNWQLMLLRAFILKGLYETGQNEEARKFSEAMQKDYGQMDWVKDFLGLELMEEK